MVPNGVRKEETEEVRSEGERLKKRYVKERSKEQRSVQQWKSDYWNRYEEEKWR